MSDMSARLSTWFRDGESFENGGCRACYGLVVSFVTMFVFCVLVATVSVWKAFVFAGLAFAAFGIGECLAPESWRIGRRGDAGEEREATAAAEGARRAALQFGLSKAAIDALPTFAYASRGAEGGGDVESAGSGDQLCSVCLEDLQAGEMARQLPACKHLFHVECIDMWLHSHRTCPICRCELWTPRTVTAKVAAVETTEQPDDDALPPV